MSEQIVETSLELPLITFNSLTSLLREEQKTKVLQKLPEQFYAGYKSFIEEKEKEALKYTQNKETAKAIKEQKVILGSSHKITELLNLRLSKISTIAIKNAIFEDEDFSTENILEEENSFYENTLKSANANTNLIK